MEINKLELFSNKMENSNRKGNFFHLPVFEEVYGKVYSGKIDFQRIVITLLYVEVLLSRKPIMQISISF